MKKINFRKKNINKRVFHPSYFKELVKNWSVSAIESSDFENDFNASIDLEELNQNSTDLLSSSSKNKNLENDSLNSTDAEKI